MTHVPWWQRAWAPLVVILAGVVLHLPSLGLGFLADDWGQQLTLEAPIEGSTMQPWSLYDFGTRASLEATFGDDSVLPWWTDPDWKARFFRPLSSAVLWAESELLGRNGPARHALGLLWHAAFLTLAWRLFLALGLTRGVALLALAVLACDDGAVMAVGWLANRNSVVEGVACAGALLFALRARERGGGALLGAWLCGALAFGAKESGLAAWLGCAFLWARAPAPSARRAAWVAAASVLLALAFLLTQGYGTHSRFYPTPWGDPLRYARHLAGLASGAPLALAGPWPLDALEMVPGLAWPMSALAALVLFLVRAPLASAARRVPEALPLALFAATSLGLQACALPSDRLLYVPALTLAPFVATFVAELRRAPWTTVRPWRGLGRVLTVTSVPLSALLVLLRAGMMVDLSRRLEPVFSQAEVERAPDGRRDVLLLSGPTVLAMLSPQAGWRFATGDPWTRFHPLQMVRRPLRVTRTDERSLEIESLAEPFLALPFEAVFLTKDGAPVGERRANGGFQFELGREAQSVRVVAHESLDGPRYRVLAWDGERWRRFELPDIGATRELRAAPPLSPLVP